MNSVPLEMNTPLTIHDFHRDGSAVMSLVVAGCGSQEGLTLVQSAELLVHHRHQVRGGRAAAVLRVGNLQ